MTAEAVSSDEGNKTCVEPKNFVSCAPKKLKVIPLAFRTNDAKKFKVVVLPVKSECLCLINESFLAELRCLIIKFNNWSNKILCGTTSTHFCPAVTGSELNLCRSHRRFGGIT